MFTKNRKPGRPLKDLRIGDRFEDKYQVKDRDILLYLGLSDDANPAYIQHDYAARTPQKKPIVPHLMLNGFIHAAISMQLPGPGSLIKEQQVRYEKPLYHYDELTLKMVITDIDREKREVTIDAEGKNSRGVTVLTAKLLVEPPPPGKPMTEQEETFENF
ncbi:MaoC/PaaZ C-terminal domain-containing protein [Alkalicoccus chagannorensis]|uniref:MaoC/PaaZ C-terminal domain-containing protein n=1 Tax=Alkalicoccus chagannorensis TaxID=427072 RepID=UPI000400F779|nr:MaoC/PaaZ C-terminal domain-containing protein [Alkalicoccus chagannorensis]